MDADTINDYLREPEVQKAGRTKKWVADMAACAVPIRELIATRCPGLINSRSNLGTIYVVLNALLFWRASPVHAGTAMSMLRQVTTVRNVDTNWLAVHRVSLARALNHQCSLIAKQVIKNEEDSQSFDFLSPQENQTCQRQCVAIAHQVMHMYLNVL